MSWWTKFKMLRFRISSFIVWRSKAIHLHGIHSPLVFELQQFLKAEKIVPTSLKTYRKTLLTHKNVLRLKDQGAGSFMDSSSQRSIRKIAKTSGSTSKKQRALIGIVRFFNAKTILELGTNLGLGTTALAVDDHTCVVSVDADPALVKFTQQQLMKHGFRNVKIYASTFEAFLKRESQTYDLIFLDGHHQYDACLKNMEQLKRHIHSNTVIIIDDIRWSSEMHRAWKSIVKDSFWKLSIDFYQYGIVQRQEHRKKQHFYVKV
ncbi:MAG: class I SAM-dependent methyltransferase [Flavobacteriaceae bacterium]|nr:class I SAM-dependent methyltransferase [Flavobacteriaceae bacterium]